MSSAFGILTEEEEISIRMPTTSTCCECKKKAEFLLQQLGDDFVCEKCCLRKVLEAYIRAK